MTDKARVIVDRKGQRLCDTGGFVVYEVVMGAVGETGEGREDVEARLRLERQICRDCGTWIAAGAGYCQMDRPYGFWHWLKYFSAIRWARAGVDPR